MKSDKARPKKLEQLKKEKGMTQWARLILEERSTNKKFSQQIKNTPDFGTGFTKEERIK